FIGQTRIYEEIQLLDDPLGREVAGGKACGSRAVRSDAAVELWGVHQVQRLGDGRIARPLARRVLVRIGSAKRVEKDRFHSGRPDFAGTRTGRGAAGPPPGPRNGGKGIGQNFRPQSGAVVPRVVLPIAAIALAREGTERIDVRRANGAD